MVGLSGATNKLVGLEGSLGWGQLLMRAISERNVDSYPDFSQFLQVVNYEIRVTNMQHRQASSSSYCCNHIFVHHWILNQHLGDWRSIVGYQMLPTPTPLNRLLTT